MLHLATPPEKIAVKRAVLLNNSLLKEARKGIQTIEYAQLESDTAVEGTPARWKEPKVRQHSIWGMVSRGKTVCVFTGNSWGILGATQCPIARCTLPFASHEKENFNHFSVISAAQAPNPG